MALPPVLSEAGLRKFRTKLCERMLATGTCDFGDRCQYSHTERPRRNPHKVRYIPNLCSTPRSCSSGNSCLFSHTRDEELFHPFVYKTRMCPSCSGLASSKSDMVRSGEQCGGYYCPWAHSQEELRTKPGDAFEAAGSSSGDSVVNFSAESRGTFQQDAHERSVTPETPERRQKVHPMTPDAKSKRGRGRRIGGGSGTQGCGGGVKSVDDARSCRDAKKGRLADLTTAIDVSQKTSDSFAEQWWCIGDQRDVWVNQIDVSMPVPSADRDGEALVGGSYREGVFLSKGGNAGPLGCSGERRCLVKMLPICRGDSYIAAHVVKEVKRWIARCGGERCAYALRRTVATTVLAVPHRPSTIASFAQATARSTAGSLAHQILAHWPLATVAATWFRQLVCGVQALHFAGVSHLCLGPQTIVSDADGMLHITDFLGKIRVLRSIEDLTHSKPDGALGMWLPPEVHSYPSSGESCIVHGSDNSVVDFYCIDAWQMGILFFYLLTGEHLFGDLREPGDVCRNIAMDLTVNLHLIDGLPVFADMIRRLTSKLPDQRLTPKQASRHPLFWSFADVVTQVVPHVSLARFELLRHFPATSACASSQRHRVKITASDFNILAEVCEKAIHVRASSTSEPLRGPIDSTATQQNAIGSMEEIAAGTAPASSASCTSCSIDSRRNLADTMALETDSVAAASVFAALHPPAPPGLGDIVDDRLVHVGGLPPFQLQTAYRQCHVGEVPHVVATAASFTSAHQTVAQFTDAAAGLSHLISSDFANLVPWKPSGFDVPDVCRFVGESGSCPAPSTPTWLATSAPANSPAFFAEAAARVRAAPAVLPDGLSTVPLSCSAAWMHDASKTVTLVDTVQRSNARWQHTNFSPPSRPMNQNELVDVLASSCWCKPNVSTVRERPEQLQQLHTSTSSCFEKSKHESPQLAMTFDSVYNIAKLVKFPRPERAPKCKLLLPK